MKCQVCGNESGQYVLCSDCYARRQKGDIVKCSRCGKWHFTNKPCVECEKQFNPRFLYESKTSLLTPVEKEYFECIKSVLPEGYSVYPQVNLASIIDRVDKHKFQNELFRNVDFGVFDNNFKPVFLIEIQDKSHLNKERQKRDQKIKKICEEAGIYILEFWEMKNIDPEKVKIKICEALDNQITGRNFSNSKAIKIEEEKRKGIADLLPVLKTAFCFFSVMAFYYADGMYRETGEKYQCFIGVFFPVFTMIIGFLSAKKGIKSTATIIIGILFSILLLLYPLVYE